MQMKMDHLKSQLGMKIKDCSALREQVDQVSVPLRSYGARAFGCCQSGHGDSVGG